MCLCGGIKIALLIMKSVFIIVGEGMFELWRWVAAEHTNDIIMKSSEGSQNFGHFLILRVNFKREFLP